MKKHLLLLISLVLLAQLLSSCSYKEFCIKAVSTSVNNFVIEVENCEKRNEAVFIQYILFERGKQRIWLLHSDNADIRGQGRLVPSLTYGKLPQHFRLMLGPGKIMRGDTLKIRVDDAFDRDGYLEVKVTE